MPVITISGNLGGNAIDVGRLVARKLGLDYVDREILVEAAQALGVSERTLAGRDDQSPPLTLRERIASFFEDFLERSAVAGAADPLMGTTSLEALMATTYGQAAALPEASHELSDRRYKEAITSVISELAAKGNVVILGRGGQAILKDRSDCLHVAVTAPFAVRVQRLAESAGLPKDRARELVEESDRGRLAYHRKYFRIDPTDASLYDIVINTGRLSPESAATLIAATVPAKKPGQA